MVCAETGPEPVIIVSVATVTTKTNRTVCFTGLPSRLRSIVDGIDNVQKGSSLFFYGAKSSICEWTAVEEVWSTRKIQFYHVTTVRDGDYVYGSTGNGPAFMAAINIKTGEIAWRKRGFAKANCLYADGKLIILDEDGTLYLATASPEDLTVHSQVELLDKVSWTVPTLSGKTLYIRDKHRIRALDLG